MKAAIITVSDGCYHGTRQDHSGQALFDLLRQQGYEIHAHSVVADEIEQIQQEVIRLTFQVDLIVTTGGTGLGPRDQTPEALRPLLEKEVLGLAELMRLRGIESTEFAALSRSIAGSRGQTLIIALPGSTKGATESLQAVSKLLPHAIDLLHGRTQH
ncbi:MAG: MogA/MoaB family molybdenum cofactor biosynthesis protein [Acidobacteria bacterium]|nr:MogA/MoaB family molybdenum cofactor biosynthesis protein [Acidobacteriota bacterium]